MMVRQQRGFTLLEAIVAITVFATSALGLYAWINSMMIGTARFGDIAIETTDLDNAIDYLSTVNPMEDPSGSVRLGEMTLNWDSELVEPIQRGNMTRAYELGLYNLEVVLERPGLDRQKLELRQVGYRLTSGQERRIGI